MSEHGRVITADEVSALGIKPAYAIEFAIRMNESAPNVRESVARSLRAKAFAIFEEAQKDETPLRLRAPFRSHARLNLLARIAESGTR